MPEQQNILKPEQRKEVAAFAKEQFAFLRNEKGFSRPLVNRPVYGMLIYRNETLGIGTDMGFSEAGYPNDHMKMTLGKLDSDGNFPKFPYYGEGRVRPFWALQSFLIRQLHIQDEHTLALDQLIQDFRRKGGVWDVEQWKQVISLNRALVHAHIDLILQQPSEVLFPTTIEYFSVGRRIFGQLACDHFAFLQEYGFRPDPIIESYGATYTWVSRDRGVQLFQDYQDSTIFFSIIKLIDGKIPTFNKKDLKSDAFIQGAGVSVSLYKLLTNQLEITDAEVDTIRNINTILSIHDDSDYDYTYANTLIRTYATLVKRHITQLMNVSL